MADELRGARDMSYELRIERQFDAPPEVVFDTFVDPSAQEELHGSGQEGWTVHRSQTDVSVGGTSTIVMGPEGKEPDTETRVYSVIDRPHRLVFRYSMRVADLGRTIDTEMTITFEPRDGGTLLTMIETGFEIEEDRDGFTEGWTEYLETLGRILKARHDT
jgi:uncharacterized protein YndB with AHSA1/START domain